MKYIIVLTTMIAGCGYDCFPTEDNRTQYAIDHVASQGWDVDTSEYKFEYFDTYDKLYENGCPPNTGACTSFPDKWVGVYWDHRPWVSIAYVAHEVGHIYFLQKYKNADGNHYNAWWFDLDDTDNVKDVDSSVEKRVMWAAKTVCEK